jgi:hypothetical protein
MTKRDYILLADVCSRFILPTQFLEALCDALENQNSRFDRDRFMRHSQNETTRTTT